MRWFLPLFILFLFCAPGSAQSFETKGGIDIHIVPLTLIDYNPRIRVGMEYRNLQRLGYSLEIGWGNQLVKDLSIIDNIWSNHYSFFEIRPEVKWYSRASLGFSNYISAEGFYSYQSDQLAFNEYYKKSTGEYIFFEEADFKRHKIGLIIKSGIKLYVGDKVTIDYSGGIGIAYRNIVYSNLVNTGVNDLNVREWWTPAYQKQGEYTVLQLSLQLKFGFLIN